MAVALGIVATLAVALFAGLGVWLVSRRINSGKIGTSDATTLWDASEKMREFLRDETNALRNEVAAARAEVALLRQEAATAAQEIIRLRDVNRELSEVGLRLTGELDQLRKKLESFKRDELQAAADKKHLVEAVAAIHELLAVLKKHGIPPPPAATKAIRPKAPVARRAAHRRTP
jgi:biopolymer transport protein ExbB/TolQ